MENTKAGNTLTLEMHTENTFQCIQKTLNSLFQCNSLGTVYLGAGIDRANKKKLTCE